MMSNIMKNKEHCEGNLYCAIHTHHIQQTQNLATKCNTYCTIIKEEVLL